MSDLNDFLEYAEEENDYSSIAGYLCEFPVEDLVNVGEPLLEPILKQLSYYEGEFDPIHGTWKRKYGMGFHIVDYYAQAAKVLGKIGDKRVVKPLIEMFGLREIMDMGFSKEHEEAAIAALTNIGKPAVRPLITALGTTDSEFWDGDEVRTCAVKALVEIGEPSVKLLTKALERKNEDVKKAAKLALEKIK